MGPLDIIEKLFDIANAIYRQKESLEANHENFHLMVERIAAIMDILKPLAAKPKEEVPQTDVFMKALAFLQNTLIDCRNFMEKYTRRSFVKRVFKAGKDEKTFEKLTAHLEKACVQLNLGISVQALFNRDKDEAARKKDQAILLSAQAQVKQLLEHQGREHKLSREAQEQFLRDRLASAVFRIQKPDVLPGIEFNYLSAWELLDESQQHYRGVWRKHPVLLTRYTVANPKDFAATVERLKAWINPHILKTLEACYEPERETIISEILPLNFATLMTQSTPEQKQQMAEDILKGLLYLHSEGYGFGVLWPNQIYADKYGQAKLLPLSALAMGKPFGSALPAWAAPELKANPRLTREADVYNYGMLLWMLFKGVEPNMQESADIRLQGIPEGYATLISSCWLPAQQRPSIQGLQERLSALSRIPIDIAPEDKAGLAPRDLRKLAENYEKTDAKQRALICYERAAQAGDTSAIVRLGFFSLTGQGVERNPLKAEQLFLQASRSDLPDYPHGHPRAQYNLGLMHLKGDGVKLNKGQAYYWLNQAAEQHYEPAEKALRELMAVQPASAKP